MTTATIAESPTTVREAARQLIDIVREEHGACGVPGCRTRQALFDFDRLAGAWPERYHQDGEKPNKVEVAVTLWATFDNAISRDAALDLAGDENAGIRLWWQDWVKARGLTHVLGDADHLDVAWEIEPRPCLRPRTYVDEGLVYTRCGCGKVQQREHPGWTVNRVVAATCESCGAALPAMRKAAYAEFGDWTEAEVEA